VARRQSPCCGRLRLTGFAAAEPAALIEDRGSASGVNRPVDATATQERAVGGVDDRVGGEPGDVTLLEPDAVARGQTGSLVAPPRGIEPRAPGSKPGARSTELRRRVEAGRAP